MNYLMHRSELRKQSIERVRTMTFGDPVTNVCAGEKNPHRLAYFVEYIVRRRKNRYGIEHKEHLAKCTDKKGGFWLTGVEVVFPDHLSTDEADSIFDTIHATLYPRT